MTIFRFLLITAICFGAFAYFAGNGNGYLAAGSLGAWFFIISASTGGFGRNTPKRDDSDDQMYKRPFGRDIHGNFSSDGMFGDD
jgi:hypothetical protein